MCPGCSCTYPGLQPYVPQAATLRAPGAGSGFRGGAAAAVVRVGAVHDFPRDGEAGGRLARAPLQGLLGGWPAGGAAAVALYLPRAAGLPAGHIRVSPWCHVMRSGSVLAPVPSCACTRALMCLHPCPYVLAPVPSCLHPCLHVPFNALTRRSRPSSRSRSTHCSARRPQRASVV